MLEWFGLRKKSATPAVAVTEAIAKRDKLFVEAKEATAAAHEAVGEVDRVQRNLLDEYERVERERRGGA